MRPEHFLTASRKIPQTAGRSRAPVPPYIYVSRRHVPRARVRNMYRFAARSCVVCTAQAPATLVSYNGARACGPQMTCPQKTMWTTDDMPPKNYVGGAAAWGTATMVSKCGAQLRLRPLGNSESGGRYLPISRTRRQLAWGVFPLRLSASISYVTVFLSSPRL